MGFSGLINAQSKSKLNLQIHQNARLNFLQRARLSPPFQLAVNNVSLRVFDPCNLVVIAPGIRHIKEADTIWRGIPHDLVVPLEWRGRQL